MSEHRTLFRAGKAPHDVLSNEAALGWRTAGAFGSNAGNMLFSDSVYTAINVPGSSIVCDAYAPEWRTLTAAQAHEINEGYDSYVVPLANAFRSGFGDHHLARLTAFIKELTIPVTVVGVGAQLGLSGDIAEMSDRVRENTKAFVSAILDRSASIGVRGEITRDVLIRLGFADNDIDVIGCPSLYADGRDLRIEKHSSLAEDAKIAVNLETNVEGIADFYRDNEAAHPDLVSVYQTLHGADLVMWGKAAPFADGLPRDSSHPAYREGRMLYFTSGVRWREYMRTRDFACGIRIHGNASALSVGTPAFMLTIDSRTQELADYHEIPRAEFASVMSDGEHLADRLYDIADFSAFTRRHNENFDRYVDFLDKNRVPHVHTPGNENPPYARRLAETNLPDAARPLPSLSAQELGSRVSWLWQGREADRFRPVGSYKPTFELDVTEIRQPGTLAMEALRKSEANAEKIAYLQPLGEKTSQVVRSNTDSLSELRRRIERLEAVSERSISSRLRRIIHHARRTLRRRAQR